MDVGIQDVGIHQNDGVDSIVSISMIRLGSE